MDSITNSKLFIISVFIIGAIFYYTKYYKSISKELKLLFFIMVAGCFGLFYLSIKESNNIEALLLNYELSNGTIDDYNIIKNKGYKGQSGNFIKFHFKVNDANITNSYTENQFIKIPDKKPSLNLNYLVIFEKENPENSFILLNYPITSEKVFQKYLDNFKNGIPENVFETD